MLAFPVVTVYKKVISFKWYSLPRNKHMYVAQSKTNHDDLNLWEIWPLIFIKIQELC